MNGNCEGPENCNDIDRHPPEKKQLIDAFAHLKNKEKQLENLKEEFKSKEAAIKQSQSSFKYQIQSALINSNLDKYTFRTRNGRALRQTAINNDVHILEKHYKNKVPKNLRSEKKKFQNIIDDFNKQFNINKQSNQEKDYKSCKTTDGIKRYPIS